MQPGERFALQQDLSLQRRKCPGERVQQGALADAVHPEQGHQFPGVQDQPELAQQHPSPMAYRKVLGMEQRGHVPRTQFLPRSSTHTTTGAPSNEVTALSGTRPASPGQRTTRSQARASTAPMSSVAGSSRV